MLERFFDPATIYLRRAQRCLDDARMAALEHETAAEHHAALARMYRERVSRMSEELRPQEASRLILDPSPPRYPRIASLKRPGAGQDESSSREAFSAGRAA